MSSNHIPTDRTGFSAEVARRLAKVSYRQLVYWDETGLVRPSIRKARGKGSRRVYCFEDVVELRVVANLLRVGIRLPAVRKAVRYLASHYVEVTRPLAQLALVADGSSILVRAGDGRSLVDATAGGQVLITVPVGVIAGELERTVTDLRAPRDLPFKVGGNDYVAVLTPDLEAGGFTIEVPALPGVVTEADSLAEARRNVVEAASLWLEVQARPARRKMAR
jgi:DNA-binding transcriptional MerR regulator/predicted RNase H-like HicB family nuclease